MLVDGVLEGVGVGQQRRDVLEQDARLGKIGNVADILRKVHCRCPVRAAVDGYSYEVSSPEATMPWTIRQAGPADAPIIVEFNRRLAEETEGKTLDPAVLAAGVAAALADPDARAVFRRRGRRRRAGPAADHLRVERLAQRLDLVDSERLRPRGGPAPRRVPVAVSARRGAGPRRPGWSESGSTWSATTTRRSGRTRELGMEESAYLMMERSPV